VNLTDAAHRKVAAYSKGMRQRIRLAQSLSHNPRVLILDEPLNGLDPLVRAEMIDIFRSRAAGGCHVVISSHILHEVDIVSDRIILLSSGYVVAEGAIQDVRNELREHPAQILIRGASQRQLASRLIESGLAMELRMHEDGRGLLVKTADADRFYLALNRLVQSGIDVESVVPADDDAHSLYEYLIGTEGTTI
jgi:ABC-2 type transport system ATP-binding protein